ncbi:MAG: hypothetical protein IJI88_03125 [Atopobiaceae bacterium]|nr:hypothetical protein [Atopobiaceae bacterium]
MSGVTLAYLLLGIASACVLGAHALLHRRRMRDYRRELTGIDADDVSEGGHGL